MKFVHRRRDRHHFLHHLAAYERSNNPGARASKENAIAARRKPVLRLQQAEELQDLLGLAGVVALVRLRQHVATRGRQHVLAGGAAHVQSAQQALAFKYLRRRCGSHDSRRLPFDSANLY